MEGSGLAVLFGGFRTSAVICSSLRRVWHLHHVLIISLGSFQYCKICFKLSKSIGSIKTVCKYRKCSFLTGLITLLTDLLQAYHQGRIGTSKTKSTGSPRSDRFALRIPLFRARRKFFPSSPGACLQAIQTPWEKYDAHAAQQCLVILGFMKYWIISLKNVLFA